MQDWASLNEEIIDEFRRNGGAVARFGGLPMLILHTIGARSGAVRLTPLIPVAMREATYVFGTAAGSRQDPAWCFNLRAHPRITVEAAGEEYVADVVELEPDDAQRLVAEQAARVPQLAEYVESAAPRPIPVFSIGRR